MLTPHILIRILTILSTKWALNYERENPGSPLPWDHARHAVHAALAKLSNEVTPLDPDRGVRTGFLILGR
jgi:hypothetical protein